MKPVLQAEYQSEAAAATCLRPARCAVGAFVLGPEPGLLPGFCGSLPVGLQKESCFPDVA